MLNDAGIPLHLGNFAGATSRTFAGSLDDLRLFGSELSAAEITDLAHNPALLRRCLCAGLPARKL